MTVIPIVVGALGTMPKGLLKGLEDLEIRGHVETIQTTDRPEYLGESWRLEETCCHSSSGEKSSANAGMKNSQRNKKKNNNLNRETEPLLIAGKNKTMRANYFNAKTDNW